MWIMFASRMTGRKASAPAGAVSRIAFGYIEELWLNSQHDELIEVDNTANIVLTAIRICTNFAQSFDKIETFARIHYIYDLETMSDDRENKELIYLFSNDDRLFSDGSSFVDVAACHVRRNCARPIRASIYVCTHSGLESDG
jgi:hypothetical protein